MTCADYKKKEKEFFENIWSKVPIKKRMNYLDKIGEEVDEYEKKTREVMENKDKYKTIEEFVIKQYDTTFVIKCAEGYGEYAHAYNEFRWFYHEHMIEAAKTDKDKQRLKEFFMYSEYKEE